MRRFAIIWVLLAIFILGVVYLPGYTKYHRLKNKELELQREIESLKTEITDLNREEKLLKTDMTRLEEVVREELGLVKPGETVIRVVEEEVPEKSESPQPPTSSKQ